ncbi:MAG: arginine--tRNA ligase [Microscillaceae bacterium]|nr:arginine--tRNA ligase [Microscillaceae bacterium]
MDIESILIKHIEQAFVDLYATQVEKISLQPTKKDFEGSHTFVTFPYTKITRQKPDETAHLLGEYLQNHSQVVDRFHVVQGFLNLTISDRIWLQAFDEMRNQKELGQFAPTGKKVMVEFSSPNTNKPLHLGHLRNNFLGDSVARILAARGYEVVKSNLVNDRGIHICKSMVAYLRHGNGETPETLGIKGDHLVGKYYVLFDKDLKRELESEMLSIQKKHSTDGLNYPMTVIQKINTLLQKLAENPEEKKAEELWDAIKKEVQNYCPSQIEAKNLLLKWEAGNEETMNLWKKMNGWVYEGFHATYRKLGIEFDKIYYESDTYLLGKDIIEEGLQKGVFYRNADSSVWIDLTADKLDQKLLLRSDGTSVYMTQDLGTADLKYQDYQIDKSVYVVGNEQDYHFKVLFKVLEKLGRPYAEGLYHLSYGMVDLPTGKMKSREGTVVDADDLVAEMKEIAAERTRERGKIEELSEQELEHLFEIIGVGALKYFLVKVDPGKRMLFDPLQSVDFEGDAAPFIQYQHARTHSILRTAKAQGLAWKPENYATYQKLEPSENNLILIIYDLERKILESADNYAPSIIAQYVYEVAKTYSRFWNECPIFQTPDPDAKSFRIALSELTGRTLARAMSLLGIEVPERM